MWGSTASVFGSSARTSALWPPRRTEEAICPHSLPHSCPSPTAQLPHSKLTLQPSSPQPFSPTAHIPHRQPPRGLGLHPRAGLLALRQGGVWLSHGPWLGTAHRTTCTQAGVPLGIDDRSRASISMPFSSPIGEGIDKASI